MTSRGSVRSRRYQARSCCPCRARKPSHCRLVEDGSRGTGPGGRAVAAGPSRRPAGTRRAGAVRSGAVGELRGGRHSSRGRWPGRRSGSGQIDHQGRGSACASAPVGPAAGVRHRGASGLAEPAERGEEGDRVLGSTGSISRPRPGSGRSPCAARQLVFGRCGRSPPAGGRRRPPGPGRRSPAVCRASGVSSRPSSTGMIRFSRTSAWPRPCRRRRCWPARVFLDELAGQPACRCRCADPRGSGSSTGTGSPAGGRPAARGSGQDRQHRLPAPGSPSTTSWRAGPAGTSHHVGEVATEDQAFRAVAGRVPSTVDATAARGVRCSTSAADRLRAVQRAHLGLAPSTAG